MLSKLKVLSFFSFSLVVTTIAFNNCSGEFAVQSGLKGSASLASLGEDVALDLGFNSTTGDVFTNTDPSVGFTVTSDSMDYVLKCYINSVEATVCKSPIDLSAQQDGDSAVRIVAQATNGRTIKEISRIFKIDRTAPVLTITSRPAAQISSFTTSVLFTVKDNVSVAADVTVQCALDAAAYADCVSPKNFSGLSLGAHTIRLKAKDKAGNVSPETSIPFSVVVGLPIVNITAAPTAYTNSTTASFTFSGTSTDSTIVSYECSIDNGATYTACTSPKSYTALENRVYNFAVRAKDAVNQVSGAATRQFTVDTVAPNTPTVSSNLMSPSNQTSLSLTFTSTDSSGIASYQCAQDAGAFAACTSPKTFAVAAGTRTFKVKSTDAAGNVSQEGTYSIVIDTAAPTLEITSGPANPTTETSAIFAFTVSDTPAGVKTVECRIDTETNYSNCASGKSYASVAIGNRSFSVRASDNAGNMITKTYAWTVNEIIQEPAATPTPPMATPPPAGQVLAGDIVDVNGTIVAAAYRDMAAKLSTDAGIAYRYGPTYNELHPTPESFPTVYQPPTKIALGDGGWPLEYQIGGPPTPTGDATVNDWYKTHQNNLWVADDPVKNPGVSHLLSSGQSINVFMGNPQLHDVWAGEGLDDMNMMLFRRQGMTVKHPIAMGRGMGKPGWNSGALVAFQDGLVATPMAGNTAWMTHSFRLPAGKVPTAIAISNMNEFAFITVWDTTALKGQLVVVSMAGLIDAGCSWQEALVLTKLACTQNAGWGERKGVWPGLHNFGKFGFSKIVGIIDLPGMMAPTDVVVSTGLDPWEARAFNADRTQYSDFYTMDLVDETKRQTYLGDGSNSQSYARVGTAVVISKSEKKAIFIDLKPLIGFYKKTYFGLRADLDAARLNVGMADNQWPYSFSFKPEQTPTIIKTVTFANKPTALLMPMWGSNARAWIATQDGVVHIFNLGNALVEGQATTAAGITEVGSVTVGKNPTALVKYNVENFGSDPYTIAIAVSRGDRRVDWIRFSGTSGSIIRTLRDSRMKDPVHIYDNESHGTLASVISVADYAGKNVANYSYGPIIYYTNVGAGRACQPPAGCPMLDAAGQPTTFNFFGSFALPGKVFSVSGANVP